MTLKKQRYLTVNRQQQQQQHSLLPTTTFITTPAMTTTTTTFITTNNYLLLQWQQRQQTFYGPFKDNPDELVQETLIHINPQSPILLISPLHLLQTKEPVFSSPCNRYCSFLTAQKQQPYLTLLSHCTGMSWMTFHPSTKFLSRLKDNTICKLPSFIRLTTIILCLTACPIRPANSCHVFFSYISHTCKLASNIICCNFSSKSSNEKSTWRDANTVRWL